jgi:drug/metabolite transporter (DMT)-like permease
MSSAMSYPNTIIFRAGLMFSLFILFLISFCIKWWLDSSQRAEHTWKAVLCSLISFAAYAFFVSSIDRVRINYTWAETAVFIASVTNFLAISIFFNNIKNIREVNPQFITEKSWKQKLAFFVLFTGCMMSGLLIYLGQLDYSYKNKVEYGIVTTSYLFYWSFIH